MPSPPPSISRTHFTLQNWNSIYSKWQSLFILFSRALETTIPLSSSTNLTAYSIIQYLSFVSGSLMVCQLLVIPFYFHLLPIQLLVFFFFFSNFRDVLICVNPSTIPQCDFTRLEEKYFLDKWKIVRMASGRLSFWTALYWNTSFRSLHLLSSVCCDLHSLSQTCINHGGPIFSRSGIFLSPLTSGLSNAKWISSASHSNKYKDENQAQMLLGLTEDLE